MKLNKKAIIGILLGAVSAGELKAEEAKVVNLYVSENIKIQISEELSEYLKRVNLNNNQTENLKINKKIEEDIIRILSDNLSKGKEEFVTCREN